GSDIACEHIIQNEWNTGFGGAVRIINNGTTAISGWNVSWEYSDGSSITSSWNANLTGSNPYSATNVGWNATIQPGQSAEFGFIGNKGANGTTPASTITDCH
ncbi:cellulose binding domain-containing protein, partial [bacterium AH-315-K03]|nr:cellulose binding domain-containing protein [bacterium AH-315-K03]